MSNLTAGACRVLSGLEGRGTVFYSRLSRDESQSRFHVSIFVFDAEKTIERTPKTVLIATHIGAACLAVDEAATRRATHVRVLLSPVNDSKKPRLRPPIIN